MAVDSSRRKAEETHNLSDHKDAGTSVLHDDNEEHISRGNATNDPRSRQRAKSCDSSLLDGKQRQLCHSLPPLVSWDDSTFNHRHYVAPRARADGSSSFSQPDVPPISRFAGPSSIDTPLVVSTVPFADLAAKWVKLQEVKHSTVDLRKKSSHAPAFREWEDLHKTDKNQADPAQMNQIDMALTIRRMASINVFEDTYKFNCSGTDECLLSGPPSPAERGSGNDIVEKRFSHPHEYFQELDELASKIFEKSMFQFYMDGKVGTQFDGSIRFKALFLENALLQTSSYDSVLRFCQDVTRIANEDIIDGNISGVGAHYTINTMHHQAIENLNHLIECRNIISAVREGIRQMKSADYCEDFISLLVLDCTRVGVAKLVRIECTWIEDLALAFEACLFQVMSQDPAMVLFNNITLLANDLTTACQELLLKLDLSVPGANSMKDIWRCAVHVLDIAVLSYSVAHTEFLGNHKIVSVLVPGRCQENQYYKFSRRSFSCIGKFLGGQEAWVLEKLLPGAPQVAPIPLSLLTDAVTFGDIWGPMWKSRVLSDEKEEGGEEERIIQYNVGNGVILPWNLPSPTSLEIRKGEIFCHWQSDKERFDSKEFINSSTFNQNDTLLIGAPIRLAVNDQCGSSFTHQRQSLRDSGAISELGTIRIETTLISQSVQATIGMPFGKVAIERKRTFKRRGKTIKQCLIEDWKLNSQNRQVKKLEFYLGVEVSTCTRNARRVRLIELFRSRTMLNHLRNGSLQWQSTDCRNRFYSAIQDQDYTAFRRLYESSSNAWQTDLGNAIGYGLATLEDTGKTETGLDLFWAPDDRPGLKVALNSSDHSWIGFLEETEVSGTLAILEDICLELPLLGIGKKCQNAHFDPRNIGGRAVASGRALNGSILETSVHLNPLCVPDSIRNGLTRMASSDNSSARQEYHWCMSSLQDGDMFEFGQKGFLEAFTPLNQGQVLAKWSKAPSVVQKIFRTVGRRIKTPLMHHENIRDDDDGTSPVQFFIISTTRNSPDSGQPSPRPSHLVPLTSVGLRSGRHQVSFPSTSQPRSDGSSPSVISKIIEPVERDPIQVENGPTINGSSILIASALEQNRSDGLDIRHYRRNSGPEGIPRTVVSTLAVRPRDTEPLEQDPTQIEDDAEIDESSALINGVLKENSNEDKSDLDARVREVGEEGKVELPGTGRIAPLDRKGKAREQ